MEDTQGPMYLCICAGWGKDTFDTSGLGPKFWGGCVGIAHSLAQEWPFSREVWLGTQNLPPPSEGGLSWAPHSTRHKALPMCCQNEACPNKISPQRLHGGGGTFHRRPWAASKGYAGRLQTMLCRCRGAACRILHLGHCPHLLHVFWGGGRPN